jgi:hypothetical protein
MSDWIDTRTRIWAALAVIGGVALFLGLEISEEPMTPLQMVLELLNIIPGVIVGVGVVLLFRISYRQQEEQRALLRDLEVARLQGQRWRTESRALLAGLGQAIDEQFSRWNLTEAEREVALLLLKGLSLKEVAAVRATTERTIPRAGARDIYKSGLDRPRRTVSVFPRRSPGAYRLRYASSSDRLIRYEAPIFLAASSPDSMIASTSGSGTPSLFAASAGDIRSPPVAPCDCIIC